jgi:hypothetical protein
MLLLAPLPGCDPLRVSTGGVGLWPQPPATGCDASGIGSRLLVFQVIPNRSARLFHPGGMVAAVMPPASEIGCSPFERCQAGLPVHFIPEGCQPVAGG